MTGRTGVLDAEMTIGLAKGEVFHHIASLYTAVYVPPGIVEEIVVNGRGRPGSAELKQALGAWVREEMPAPALVQRFAAEPISAHDREVLALVQQRQAFDREVHLLGNDEVVLRVAGLHQLRYQRVTDLVVAMKQRGLVSQARSVFELMVNRGFGIRDIHLQAALQTAGE